MTKTMFNVKERISNLNDILSNVTGADDLCFYSGDTYVSDAIIEIADSYTSIHYADIINFISAHVEEVNDTIAEFGWDGCGGDLYKAGQLAELCMIENEINTNLNDAITLYAYMYLNDKGIEEVSEDFDDELTEFIENGVDTFEKLTDFINENKSLRRL